MGYVHVCEDKSTCWCILCIKVLVCVLYAIIKKQNYIWNSIRGTNRNNGKNKTIIRNIIYLAQVLKFISLIFAISSSKTFEKRNKVDFLSYMNNLYEYHLHYIRSMFSNVWKYGTCSLVPSQTIEIFVNWGNGRSWVDFSSSIIN
jgi:hypothetical protein